jgi:ureidoglycolate hydrolase
MLIDKQAPPSDENIYITQSDHEILIVIRGHLFTIISPFSSYLRKVLQAVTETPPSGQNNFIPNTESNFLIVVCSHFPNLSYRSRILRVKTHRQQERRPLAEKIFSMNSPTPTSY